LVISPKKGHPLHEINGLRKWMLQIAFTKTHARWHQFLTFSVILTNALAAERD
jgi:hypothetical protein